MPVHAAQSLTYRIFAEFETQNKALIDTRGVRKLSSKIPRHMPYFSVEFGLQLRHHNGTVEDGGFVRWLRITDDLDLEEV
ncbi:MAG: hypothetical protein ACPIOQ_55750, partial [Promethearchaeia archaeon]